MLAPLCCAASCTIPVIAFLMSTSLLGFCLVHLQTYPAHALCRTVKASAASCTSFSAISCLACVLSVSQHFLHITLYQSHGWRCTCRAGAEQALSRAPGFWRLLPRGARLGRLFLATVPADAGDDQVRLPACLVMLKICYILRIDLFQGAKSTAGTQPQQILPPLPAVVLC